MAVMLGHRIGAARVDAAGHLAVRILDRAHNIRGSRWRAGRAPCAARPRTSSPRPGSRPAHRSASPAAAPAPRAWRGYGRARCASVSSAGRAAAGPVMRTSPSASRQRAAAASSIRAASSGAIGRAAPSSPRLSAISRSSPGSERDVDSRARRKRGRDRSSIASLAPPIGRSVEGIAGGRRRVGPIGADPVDAVHRQHPVPPGQSADRADAAGDVEELLRRVHLERADAQHQPQRPRRRRRRCAADSAPTSRSALGDGGDRQPPAGAAPFDRRDRQIAVAQRLDRCRVGPATSRSPSARIIGSTEKPPRPTSIAPSSSIRPLWPPSGVATSVQ